MKGTLPASENRWISIEDVLMNEEYRTKLQKALFHEDIPKSVSLLRRIDVVIWINNEKKFRKNRKLDSKSLRAQELWDKIVALSAKQPTPRGVKGIGKLISRKRT